MTGVAYVPPSPTALNTRVLELKPLAPVTEHGHMHHMGPHIGATSAYAPRSPPALDTHVLERSPLNPLKQRVRCLTAVLLLLRRLYPVRRSQYYSRGCWSGPVFSLCTSLTTALNACALELTIPLLLLLTVFVLGNQ